MVSIRLSARQLKVLLDHWQKYQFYYEQDYIEEDSGFQMALEGDESCGDIPTKAEQREVERTYKFINTFEKKLLKIVGDLKK